MNNYLSKGSKFVADYIAAHIEGLVLGCALGWEISKKFILKKKD